MDVLLAGLGALAIVHVAYALWTAKRLDRMHARLDAAGAALDQQLRLRAQAALDWAAPAGSAQTAEAARSALAVTGLGHDREVAENALSRALASTDPDAGLIAVNTRTAFARRFHNDAVRDALTVRRRRIVRWFRLAGSARMPTFFEMDDSALDRRTIAV